MGESSFFLQHLSVDSVQDEGFLVPVLKASNMPEVNISDAVNMRMFFCFMSLGLIILCGWFI